MNDVPILLLAAGASKRMRGVDKLMQLIDGKPLLRRTADIAIATGHPLTVTLPTRPHPRFAALAGIDAKFLPVADASEGINASLRTGLNALMDARSVMVILADLPALDTEHLKRVFDAQDQHPEALVWRGATADGQPGHPTIIDQSLFADICALKGDAGAQSVLQTAPTCLVTLPGNVARVDLDTPEMWKKWQDARR